MTVNIPLWAFPKATEDDIINWLLRSPFAPYIRPFIDVDELRPYIVQLAPSTMGGKDLSPEEFLSIVQGSQWFQNRTNLQQNWATLTGAEKENQIRQVAAKMFDWLQTNAGQEWVVKKGYNALFARIGSKGDNKLRFWAYKVASGAMSYEEWQVNVSQSLLKDPTSKMAILDLQSREELARMAKRPEEIAEELWMKARGEYFVNFSKETAKQWANDIINGRSSFGEFNDFLRKQAATLYPAYAESINNGILPKALFGPALTTLAGELEVSEEQVLGDNKLWGEITAQAAGSKDPFTASDWVRYARSLPQWRRTRGAQDMAATFSDKLLKQFGAIA